MLYSFSFNAKIIYVIIWISIFTFLNRLSWSAYILFFRKRFLVSILRPQNKPCRINKLHIRRRFLDCKLNFPFPRILPIWKHRSSHSHLKKFYFLFIFKRVFAVFVFRLECKQRSENKVAEICITINASVAPVMMSLHL